MNLPIPPTPDRCPSEARSFAASPPAATGPARRAPRRGVRTASFLVVVSALVVTAGRSCAEPDDFEFGKRLIQRGYPDYARRVYQGILSDASRSAEAKDQARYGMALLGLSEVESAKANSKVDYAAVVAKYREASGQIQQFVQKYPSDKQAEPARLELGKLHLGMVTWGRLLSDDKEACEARGTTPDAVRADTLNAIGAAAETFSNLASTAKSPDTKALAEFYGVVTKYFAGIAQTKCSAAAVSAFKLAATALESFAVDNEANLTGVWAMSYCGLAQMELGACEGDPEARETWYSQALGWFIACINTPDNGDDYRRVICQGYLNVGRLGNQAGVQGKTDFRGQARRLLSSMLERTPVASRFEDGILAMVEHAALETSLGNAEAASDILRKASDFADQGGFGYARSRANKALADLVTSGGAVAGGDPGTFVKIADSFFAEQKFAEAATAYRAAIASAPAGVEAMVKIKLPTWMRLASCFKNMTPPLWIEAATAYDAVCDEVRGGSIQVESEADPASRMAWEAANQQKQCLVELFKITDDASVRDRIRDLTNWITTTFKGFGSVSDQSFSLGRELFHQALRDRDKPGSTWKQSMGDARAKLTEAATSLRSEYQDDALVYLIRIGRESDDCAAAIADADKAFAFWKTPAAAKRIEVGGRFAENRKVQQGWAAFWKADCLQKSGRAGDAMTELDGFSSKWKGADKDAVGRAQGLYVDLLMKAGLVEKAESTLDALTLEHPDYYNLPHIFKTVFDHYNDQVDEVEKGVLALNEQLQGTAEAPGIRGRLAAKEKEIADNHEAQGVVVAILANLQKVIDVSKDPKAVEEATAQLPAAQARLDALKKDLPPLVAAKKGLSDEIAAIVAKRTGILNEQLTPLRKATVYVRRLDEVLEKRAKSGGTPRDARSVYGVGYRYYRLATRQADAETEDPETPKDLEWARKYIADYLAFPEVAELPLTDDFKRTAMTRLGAVQYELAKRETDAAKQRALYADAVANLEVGLPRLPQNLPFVRGHLGGTYKIVAWKALPPLDGRWTIPVPDEGTMLASGKEFKTSISRLNEASLPKYTEERRNATYLQVLRQVQEHVAKTLSEGEAGKFAKELHESGLNDQFMREHANTRADLYLTLARAYARSGLAENEIKAFNCANCVWKVAGAVDDLSDWWEARTLAFEIDLDRAVRLASISPADKKKAEAALRSIDDTMSTLKLLYPRVGGLERREATVREWKALRVRLGAAMRSMGLTPKPMDVERVESDETTPAPGSPR